MRLVFVHGWSVTNTDTYGGLPEAMAAAAPATGLTLDIQHIHLGRYISFHDEVTLDDIARAMDRALRDLPGNSDTQIAPFSCITHSTGGPVVLTGQGIDHAFYDFLNSYLVEDGSDGVVRVAGANMNYRYLELAQNQQNRIGTFNSKPLYALEPTGDVRASHPMPIGVYGNHSHSGKKMGIMGSIKPDDTDVPVVQDILKCFRVASHDDYRTRGQELAQWTASQQEDGNRFCMLVFNIRDDQGEHIGQNDYDIYLLAGNRYQPHQLPKGFFRDKQMNGKNGRLVYYLDADKMSAIKDGKFGLRVVARPDSGFSYYQPAEFRSDGVAAQNVLLPNQTLYVDVTLHRFVDEQVFRFDPATERRRNFKKTKPSGRTV